MAALLKKRALAEYSQVIQVEYYESMIKWLVHLQFFIYYFQFILLGYETKYYDTWLGYNCNKISKLFKFCSNIPIFPKFIKITN